MECEEIKGVIPKYFNHTASEEEIKLVEEHLCVCHDCRASLGALMDKLTISEESKPLETAQASEMEYIPLESKDATFPPPAESIPEPVAEIQPAKPEVEEAPPNVLADEKEDMVSENIEPAVVESLQQPQPEEPEAKTSEPIYEEPTQKNEAYSLDKLPLEKEKSGIFEYVILFAGIIVFAVFLYLLLKGRTL